MATLQPSEGHRAQLARPPQSDSRCFEGAVCCRTTLTHEDLCCVSRPILKSNPLIFLWIGAGSCGGRRPTSRALSMCYHNSHPLPQFDSHGLKLCIVPVVLCPAASASPPTAPAPAAAVTARPPFGSDIICPQSSSLNISIGRSRGCCRCRCAVAIVSATSAPPSSSVGISIGCSSGCSGKWQVVWSCAFCRR